MVGRVATVGWRDGRGGCCCARWAFIWWHVLRTTLLYSRLWVVNRFPQAVQLEPVHGWALWRSDRLLLYLIIMGFFGL